MKHLTRCMINASTIGLLSLQIMVLMVAVTAMIPHILHFSGVERTFALTEVLLPFLTLLRLSRQTQDHFLKIGNVRLVLFIYDSLLKNLAL
jgi:hypothetical protein